MHFYAEENGEVYARHFVPVKSRPGEMRPTRITDVRKWWKEGQDVVPSVTTVLNVLDKAALVNWKVDQHLEQAHRLTMDYLQTGSVPEINTYIAQVKSHTEMEMDKAPQAGTDVHKSLEDYMLGGEPAQEHYEICRNVEALLQEKCGEQEWEYEKRFISAFGFGGCADLSSKEWVIDYKTKQTADKFKPGKMAYPDHSRQLAAYRDGLEAPFARCANIFICIETGEVDFHEHTEQQLSEGWEVFRRALEIWQITNGYNQKAEEAA